MQRLHQVLILKKMLLKLHANLFSNSYMCQCYYFFFVFMGLLLTVYIKTPRRILDIVNSSKGPHGIAGLRPMDKSFVTEVNKVEEQDRNPSGLAVFQGYK